jgi:gluconate 2-dehydrogenase alpha chain
MTLIRAAIQERWRRAAIAPEMTIGDFGIEWDEIELFYDRLKTMRRFGQGRQHRRRSSRRQTCPASAAQGEFQCPSGNGCKGELFAEAAQNLGYKPFPLPASNASGRSHTNPEGARLCLHLLRPLLRFGGETNAKAASPNTTLVPALALRGAFPFCAAGHGSARSCMTAKPAPAKARRTVCSIPTRPAARPMSSPPIS